jgi:hypothetical protein
MDIKYFEYFDGNTYLAVGFNSYVQIYQLKLEKEKEKEEDETLKEVFKIDTQIGIYKIKVRKIDRTKSGWPPI